MTKSTRTQTILLRVTPELAAWLDEQAREAGHGKRAVAAKDLLEEIRKDDLAANGETV